MEWINGRAKRNTKTIQRIIRKVVRSTYRAKSFVSIRMYCYRHSVCQFAWRSSAAKAKRMNEPTDEMKLNQILIWMIKKSIQTNLKVLFVSFLSVFAVLTLGFAFSLHDVFTSELMLPHFEWCGWSLSSMGKKDFFNCCVSFQRFALSLSPHGRFAIFFSFSSICKILRVFSFLVKLFISTARHPALSIRLASSLAFTPQRTHPLQRSLYAWASETSDINISKE